MCSVTVVIPCYNASCFIRETLDSALAQTHPPLEILLVDDGSTDDSADIARTYGPPVRVISQTNQGESVARNRGIDEARGEWIAFLDADDIWMPQKLERQLEVTDDSIVAVHTNVAYFGARSGKSHIEEIDECERYEIHRLACANHFITPSALIVRRCMSPRFPTWTRYGEDLLYFLDLVRCGRVQLVREPLTKYRKHDCSQSRSSFAGIGWHKAIMSWMSANPDLLSPIMRKQICDANLCRVASDAWKHKSARRWSEYWQTRKYLEQYRGVPEVDLVLNNPIYPSWIYAAWDAVAPWLRIGGDETNAVF